MYSFHLRSLFASGRSELVPKLLGFGTTGYDSRSRWAQLQEGTPCVPNRQVVRRLLALAFHTQISSLSRCQVDSLTSRAETLENFADSLSSDSHKCVKYLPTKTKREEERNGVGRRLERSERCVGWAFVKRSPNKLRGEGSVQKKEYIG